MPARGALTIVSTQRKEDLVLPGLVISPRRPDGWLLTLRARALEICDELGPRERRPLIEDMVGAAAGTREARAGARRLLAARAAGHEYDPDRVARLDELAGFLVAIPADLDIPFDLAATPDEAATSLPFFEAYFSNFIEGTEFSIDEAEVIVVSRTIPQERPEDAHDVLGTFERGGRRPRASGRHPTINEQSHLPYEDG